MRTCNRAGSSVPKWKVHSAVVRDRLRMGATSAPWTSQAKLTGLPDNARMRDVIDVAWGARREAMPAGSTKSEMARNFFCDPTQSVSRTPWQEGLAAIAQGSMMYSFEKDLVLSGFDHLRALGIPEDAAPGQGTVSFSDKQCRSLAGEAFGCPVVTTITYAFWLNPYGNWWPNPKPQPQDGDDSDGSGVASASAARSGSPQLSTT